MNKYLIKNLDCAGCALQIENHLKKLPEAKYVSLNFATLTLNTNIDDINLIQQEITRIAYGVTVSSVSPNTGSEYHDNHKDTLKELSIIAITGLIFIIVLLFENSFHRADMYYLEYFLVISAYLIAGYSVLKGAWQTIKVGNFFDENVLMTLATLSAILIHAMTEALGVMIFFKAGELLQNLAVNRSRRSIVALSAAKPDFAWLKKNNEIIKVIPESVNPGDSIIVKPGEKIPLDGIITQGHTELNTSPLTGEAKPESAKEGDSVLAGEINISCLITIKVTKKFAESSISKILDLVENAVDKKAKTELFITAFARYYTPLMILLAAIVAVFPPLFINGALFSDWIYRALVLLVISCPCALVISIPLGYFGGIGNASKNGILIKGANYLDALAKVKTVIFDKTGTLTKGIFKVNEIIPSDNFSTEQLLYFAALAESHSNHLIAKSITEHFLKNGKTIDSALIVEYREIAGLGVMVKTFDHLVMAGNANLMIRENLLKKEIDSGCTVVHIAVDGKYAGHIELGDEIKDDAVYAIDMLKKSGIKKIAMLTGDNHVSARETASKLGIENYHSGLMPEDKVRFMEQYIAEKKSNENIAFVGDGINDSPVLARADVGIAMGGNGTDAAIDIADVVLMTDHPSKVVTAVNIAKNTRLIVCQNIILALSVKIAFVFLGVLGVATLWEAVFADVGVALAAVINSSRSIGILRALKQKTY